MRVIWPPNVRADVEIWGPFTVNHLVVTGMVFGPAALLALFAPLSLVGKAGLLVGGLAAGAILAVIDAPRILRLGRSYAARPRQALGRSLEEALSAVSIDQHGIVRGPGYVARWWAVHADVPWQFLGDAGRASLMAAYAALAEDVAGKGAELIWCLEFVPDLPRRELERQRRLADQAAPGLARLIRARAATHARAGEEGQALRAEAYVGAVADSEEVLHAVSQAVEARLGPAVLPLAPEAVRDLAWRQLIPTDWVRAEPPVRVAWLTPDAAPSLSAAPTCNGRRVLEYE